MGTVSGCGGPGSENRDFPSVSISNCVVGTKGARTVPGIPGSRLRRELGWSEPAPSARSSGNSEWGGGEGVSREEARKALV